MPPKQPFKAEPVTAPATRRPPAPGAGTNGAALKDRRARAEAPTLPPPNAARNGRSSRPASGAVDTPAEGAAGRISGMRARKPTRPLTSAATIDEVVADLSNDPRRERDDNDDDE